MSKKTKFQTPDGLTAETQKFMTAVVKKLESMHALEECDFGSLYMLANSYDCYVLATQMVRKEGLVITLPQGGLTEHPAAKLQNKYYGQVLAFMKEIGVTLKSRERIKSLNAEGEQDDSPINQFL